MRESARDYSPHSALPPVLETDCEVLLELVHEIAMLSVDRVGPGAEDGGVEADDGPDYCVARSPRGFGHVEMGWGSKTADHGVADACYSSTF